MDFETFYDEANGYSLKEMTPYDYARDARFNPYMVSVVGEGLEYVGDPKAFDWTQLDGAILVFHNAGFDATVIDRMAELKWIPEIKYEVKDTADMVAYLGSQRNLAAAVYTFFGEVIKKEIRATMDGKTLTDAEAMGIGDSLRKYALDDSRWCYKLWTTLNHLWPEREQRISEYNRLSARRGVRIDREAVKEGIVKLEQIQSDALANMPWVADGEKPLSTAAFGKQARYAGIESVPASLKKDNPVMVEWMAKNSKDNPFIKARMDYASSNPHLTRLRNMIRLADDEDVLRFSVKYWGAHTGRASGGSEDEESASFNILNIPSKPVFGVNLRHMILPHKGYQFAIYDYAQIEARLVLWMAGATTMLDNIKKFGNIYLAFAVSVGWLPTFDPKDVDKVKADNPELYKRAKETVLGGGYGMGWKKFRETAARKGIVFSEEESRACIESYRNSAPEVVRFWYAHQALMERSVLLKDKVHEIELPSGRVKCFYEPEYLLEQNLEGKWTRSLVAAVTRGCEKKYLWGGKIVENIVQSTARDLMYEAADAVSIAHPAWFYSWNAYDEVIFEVPEEECEGADAEFNRLLCESTPWANGCPLAVEGEIVGHYKK